MNAPSTAGCLQLHWVQPTMFARHFELYSDDGLIGELRFKNAATAHGALTISGSATTSWTIKTAGLLKPRVILRDAKAMDDLAVFRSKLRGDGWVEFIKGSKFQWKASESRRAAWGFSNEQEEWLFVLKPKRSNPLKIQSVVEIDTQWRDLDELPSLLMLSWYLRVQDFYAGW